MGLLLRKGHWSNEEAHKYMMAKNIIKSLGICGLCITVERRADVLARVALISGRVEDGPGLWKVCLKLVWSLGASVNCSQILRNCFEGHESRDKDGGFERKEMPTICC